MGNEKNKNENGRNRMNNNDHFIDSFYMIMELFHIFSLARYHGVFELLKILC